MKKTTDQPTPAQLLRQFSTLQQQNDAERNRRLNELERGLRRAQKQIAELKTRHERVIGQHAKALATVKDQNQKLKAKLAKQTAKHKARQNQRHVHHNVGRAEKAHLLRTWGEHRHDEDALTREGRRLARAYKLDYQRQVKRWFTLFGAMDQSQRRKLRAAAIVAAE